jgi:hypothetical protein
MKKPESHTITLYDYHECAKYISEKLGRDVNDYSGKFPKQKDINYHGIYVYEDVEYQNFWHWLCDETGAVNGDTVEFYRDCLDDIKEGWVRKIYGAFLEEFCEKDKDSVMFQS